MKLLLDESVPRKLAACFPQDFEIRTVPKMGWAGIENGELIQRAAKSGFDALITADRNIEHQQNLKTLPITVIVLRGRQNRMQELQPLVPQAIAALQDENIGKSLVNVEMRTEDLNAGGYSP